MSSLFEVYDPYTFFLGLSLNWFFMGSEALPIFCDYFILYSSSLFIILTILNFLASEYKVLFKVKAMSSGLVMFFAFLFVYVLTINLLGLIPYVFSCSSHFVFALSFGLPFWLSFMIMSILKFTNSFFVHLIPLGTPLALIPLMVLIETISGLIRPWSLSIRLMANMISGHLLMSLLGDCGFIMFLMQAAFFSFEFFVCFIQAYVFSVLLTLYSSEI